MASLAAVTPAMRARTRVAAHAGTLAAVGASLAFSSVFIARTAFSVGRTTYFSLFDDAMVSMQYARNLAHGNGLVWNAHQPAVEGYTNFLWTMWMALVHLMPVPESKISLVVMVTSAVLLAANVVTVRALASEVGASLVAGLIAAFATALYYPLSYWALRGMEVGLLTLIVSSATLVALRLSREWSGGNAVLLCVLLALGSLTRPDAVLLMLCLVVYVAWRARRSVGLHAAVPVLASVLVPTLGLTVFRELYYHALLPNTYYLKLSGVQLVDRLHRGLVAFFELELAHLWGPTITVVAVFVSRRRIGHQLGLLLALVATACVYSIYVGGDAWEWMLYTNRYVAPVVPLLFVLAAICVDEFASRPERRRVLLATLGLGTALVLTLSLGAHAAVRGTGGLGWPYLPPVAPLAASLLAATWIALRRNAELAGSIVAGTVVLLLVVGTNLEPVRHWVASNAYHVHDDAATTRQALALRGQTSPTMTVAVNWAGAIPYFSHRPAVDILGKSDRFVARLPAHRPFVPGHSKWDYAYSFGKLRPDVIAQEPWRLTSRERALLRRWGYVRPQHSRIPAAYVLVR